MKVPENWSRMSADEKIEWIKRRTINLSRLEEKEIISPKLLHIKNLHVKKKEN